MAELTDPFLEVKWGYSEGEDGWGPSLNADLVKFAFFHNRRLDGSVSTLPPTPVDGEAYFNTTDQRVYYRANSTWYSSPVPLGTDFTLKGTEEEVYYDGTTTLSPLSPDDTLELKLNGDTKVIAVTTGAGVRGTLDNSPTTPLSAQDANVQLQTTSGAGAANLGFTQSSSTLRLENLQWSGLLRASGKDDSGAVVDFFTGDPVIGDFALNYAGAEVVRTLAAASGGLEVNNTLTGVGFERVVTASEIADSVDGPGSATDNAVARYDATTGNLIQNSGVIIDDSDNVTGVATLTGATINATSNLQEAGTNLSAKYAQLAAFNIFTDTQQILAADPSLVLWNNASAANEGIWNLASVSNGFEVQLFDDTPVPTEVAIGVYRSGSSVTTVNIPNGQFLAAGTIRTVDAASGGLEVNNTLTGVGFERVLTTGDLSGIGGDFSGPASSTDNAIVRFDGTGGKLGQNSGVIIDDSDNITGAASLALSSIVPYFDFTETGVTADSGRWRFYADGEQFVLQTLADSGAGGDDILTVTRTNTAVNTVNLGGVVQAQSVELAKLDGSNSFTQLNADDVRIDDNVLLVTASNTDLVLQGNGTGDIVLKDPSSDSVVVSFRDSTDTLLGSLQSTSAGVFLRNVVNGQPVTIHSNDAGGVDRNLIIADPDTGVDFPTGTLSTGGNTVLDSTDLAANGGTIAEENRQNDFSSDTQILKSSSTFDIVRGDPTLTHFFDLDATALTTGALTVRLGRLTSTTGDVVFDFYNADGTADKWASMSKDAGMVYGSPPGGPQGAGTINAEKVYVNGDSIAPIQAGHAGSGGVSINNQSAQINLTGFTGYTLAPNSTYRFKGIFRLDADSSTPEVDIGLAISAGSLVDVNTSRVYYQQFREPGTFVRAGDYAFTTIQTINLDGSSQEQYLIEGVATTGASGATVDVQWSQNTSSADFIYVGAGSYLIFELVKTV